MIMKIGRRFALVVSAGLWAAGAGAQAQNGDPGTAMAFLEQALSAQQSQERLAAIQADRSAAIAAIMARYSSALPDGGNELQRALAKVPADVVLKASEAATLPELDRVLFGRAAAGVSPSLDALGSGSSDLVYFPVTPCRLVDTRLAGGVLTAGVPRDFDSNGLNLSGQGGSAIGCGVNDPDPAAIAVTITAVNPQGAGDLRAWPASGAIPNASVVNYALPGQGLNLANTTILPLLQSVANINEFTIQADAAAAQVVVDVVGYFFSPLATGPQCQTLVTAADQTATFSFESPDCPATYTLTGGGHNWISGATDVWFWQSAPNLARTAWHVRGNVNRGGASSQITAFAICCRVPGR